MNTLMRPYAVLIRLMLHHRNPRYTPVEWAWYVVLALSIPEGFVLVGLLSLWVGRYGAVLPAGSGLHPLAGFGAVLLFGLGPLLAANHWLLFRSRYVRDLALPSTSVGRYRATLAAFMGACFSLFLLMTA